MLVEQLNCAYFPSLNPALYPYSPKIPKEHSAKRVLIIDDDPSVLNLLKAVFSEDRRLKVFTAVDPFDAMEVLNHQVVDTIILDWTLPEMSGPETLIRTERFLKTDPDIPFEWEDKKVKVILFTAKDRNQCKATSSKHFRYTGYVGKNNSNIDSIIQSLHQLIYQKDT